MSQDIDNQNYDHNLDEPNNPQVNDNNEPQKAQIHAGRDNNNQARQGHDPRQNQDYNQAQHQMPRFDGQPNQDPNQQFQNMNNQQPSVQFMPAQYQPSQPGKNPLGQSSSFMAQRNQNHLNQQRYNQNSYNYFKEKPLHKAPWNERFFVTSVLNNALPHKFFREFFDKPQRNNVDLMIKPDKPEIPIEDFYRSTSLSQLLFDSADRKLSRASSRTILRPGQSKYGNRPSTQNASISRKSLRKAQSQKNLLVAEFNWDEKFNIMASKNNIQAHKNYHEFFDKPIEYDARGYAYSKKPEPFMVYKKKTPILKSPLYMSQERQKEVSQILRSYESTKRLSTPQLQFRESVEDFSKPLITQSSHNKRMLSTASTKVSRNSDNIMRMQRTGWSERIGLPISTYNETVFPRYKILFEHL